jgi:hypothetical protein
LAGALDGWPHGRLVVATLRSSIHTAAMRVFRRSVAP